MVFLVLCKQGILVCCVISGLSGLIYNKIDTEDPSPELLGTGLYYKEDCDINEFQITMPHMSKPIGVAVIWDLPETS